MTNQLRIHPNLQAPRTLPPTDTEKRGLPRDFTGLVSVDAHRGWEIDLCGSEHYSSLVALYPGKVRLIERCDWDALYFKAILRTHNTCQWDAVEIFINGKQRGWLSGQA